MSLQGYNGDDDSILGSDHTSSSVYDDERKSSDSFFSMVGLLPVNKIQFFAKLPTRRLKRRRKCSGNAEFAPISTPITTPYVLYHGIPNIVEFSLSSSSQDLNVAALRTSSSYYSSRGIFKFFQDQYRTNYIIQNGISVRTSEPGKEFSNSKIVSNREICFKPSPDHLNMEDAITFSSLPRIVMEADSPHRIVHTNAAYARRYGVSHSSFQAPHTKNFQDLKIAMEALFKPGDVVVIYPVCGSDKPYDVPRLSHICLEMDPCDKASSLENRIHDNNVFSPKYVQKPFYGTIPGTISFASA